MAHNRAERRYKTALIKRKLEQFVQQELANEEQRIWFRGSTGYCPFIPLRQRLEVTIRRRRFRNEGRHGRVCWDCGPHACDWCLRDFYRKHFQRAQALENDLREDMRGGYDALRSEGADIPSAPLARLPRVMGRCEIK